MSLALIDYGAGNLHSVHNALKAAGAQDIRVTADPDIVAKADRIVLPGVGAFAHCMEALSAIDGMTAAMERRVRVEGTPFLGICVGMQMLSDGSEEGSLPGLGWIPGNVRFFANTPVKAKLPMPHMGWNTVCPKEDSALFKYGFESEPQFYFLHSYYFDAKNKNDVSATAHYGIDFDAVVSKGNIHGIQCHPEKSHHWGSQLLKNFAEL